MDGFTATCHIAMWGKDHFLAIVVACIITATLFKWLRCELRGCRRVSGRVRAVGFESSPSKTRLKGIPHPVYNDNTGVLLVEYHQVLDYFVGGLRLPEHSDRKIIVLDVGAHIGLFSLEVLKRTAGNATIYAFEPVPCIGAVLHANREEAVRYYPNCDFNVCVCGLGSVTGTFLIHYNESISTMSTSVPAEASRVFNVDKMATAFATKMKSSREHRETHTASSPLLLLVVLLPTTWVIWLFKWYMESYFNRSYARVPVECELRTLSAFLSESLPNGTIDVLKIDVEGSELAVLRGMALQDWERIATIVLEVHDTHGKLEEIQRILRVEAKFAKIKVYQEEIFRDCWPVYMILATRRADATAMRL